jgi:thiamine-phosphate pyrophosphorylase
VKPLSSCFLYGIVDLGYVTVDDLATVTIRLVRGGVDILQLRAKKHSKLDILRCAQVMLPLTKPEGIPLIINDYPDLLREVDADGCHVGQEDFGVAEARELAGRICIVGKSTHSMEQACAAQREQADYIGFGPLFPTATKPSAKEIGLSEIRTLHEQVQLPIFVIGGVKLRNLEEIIQAGAKRVCVVSDLLLAADVEKQTAEVKRRVAGVSGSGRVDAGAGTSEWNHPHAAISH